VNYQYETGVTMNTKSDATLRRIGDVIGHNARPTCSRGWIHDHVETGVDNDRTTLMGLRNAMVNDVAQRCGVSVDDVRARPCGRGYAGRGMMAIDVYDATTATTTRYRVDALTYTTTTSLHGRRVKW